MTEQSNSMSGAAREREADVVVAMCCRCERRLTILLKLEDRTIWADCQRCRMVTPMRDVVGAMREAAKAEAPGQSSSMTPPQSSASASPDAPAGSGS